jgi:hypothetical protein
MGSHTSVGATPHADTTSVDPQYQPEQCVYTDGSDIMGQPRLAAAVMHVPTCTRIYIDEGGTNEPRIIMRAVLVAIFTALDKFATHEWTEIFQDSLSSLQAIRHRYTNLGTRALITITTTCFL